MKNKNLAAKEAYQKLKKKRSGKRARFADCELIYDNIKKEEKGWRTDSLDRQSRMLEELRLPLDLLRKNPVITLCGNYHLIVENYKKLTEYEENRIRILTGIGCLQVNGIHLRIGLYTRDEIKITGCIQSIEIKETVRGGSR